MCAVPSSVIFCISFCCRVFPPRGIFSISSWKPLWNEPITPIITGTMVTFVRFHNVLISTARSGRHKVCLVFCELGSGHWGLLHQWLWLRSLPCRWLRCQVCCVGWCGLFGCWSSTRSSWIRFLRHILAGVCTIWAIRSWSRVPQGASHGCIYRRCRVFVDTLFGLVRRTLRWCGGWFLFQHGKFCTGHSFPFWKCVSWCNWSLWLVPV